MIFPTPNEKNQTVQNNSNTACRLHIQTNDIIFSARESATQTIGQ